MDIEELFLRTYDDLESRISSTDVYEMLGASRMIRQLFLDGDKSIVDLVNRTYQLKRIRFEIVDVTKLCELFTTPGMPAFEFLGVQDGLDPDVIPNPPIKIVNRDEFFQTTVQISGGKSFTVKDIVLHQANAMGGVHAGKYAGEPKDEKERILSAIEESIGILALPAGLRQLKAIGKVILKALQPLRIILICSGAIEENANNTAAYYNRGTVFSNSNKPRKAILDFDRAIELGSAHPNLSDVYYNRGHTFLKLAILDFEKYISLAPDSPERTKVLEEIKRLKTGSWQNAEAAQS